MTNSPLDLGFSEEYESYRPFQAQTLEKIIASNKRLIVVSAPTGSGKSVLALGAARIYAKRGLQTRILTNNKYLQNQYMCLPPEEPVLTKDLTWKPGGDLVLGDMLIGFEENRTTISRRYIESEVISLGRLVKPIFRYWLEDGTYLDSTEDHPVLGSYNRGAGYRWLPIGKATSLQKILEPWPSVDSRDLGWLSGLFDGEGSLSKNIHAGLNLVLAQNEGKVLEKAAAILNKNSISYSIANNDKHSSCKFISIKGGFAEVIRTLGITKPVRLLDKLYSYLPNLYIKSRRLSIIKVESLGKQEVVTLGTSTSTFIAKGLLVHNSYRFSTDIPLQGIGKSNFPCVLPGIDPGTTAAEAPCNHGFNCNLKEPLYENHPESIECPFYRQRDMADRAKISILNYPFYFYENRYGLFPTDLLICDEGHQIDSQILSVASTGFEAVHLSELSRIGVDLPEPKDLLLSNNPAIQSAAQAGLMAVSSHLDSYEELPPPLYVDLQRRLQSLVDLKGKLAVAQEYTYAPILSEQFANDYLRAKKIVLMSATIFGPEYWSHRLGIEDVEYLEVPSSFPAQNRPIYIQPVCSVSQKWWDKPDEQKKLINAIDNIIKRHIPKKGLIHSVSYRLTDWILTNSMFAGSGYLIKGDSDQAVDDWKKADKGILVSPRATEGVDLPDELCDFIIIPKVPYLSLGDQVTRLQMQEIPGFYEYKAMSAIIQGAGRGMRHKDDKCDTYILDQNWYHLFRGMKDQLPRWFTEALIYQKKL